MDTAGVIQEHSKIKLELYRLYLEGYLAILLNTPFYHRISINDFFAGSGRSENGEKGSALIAAETIKHFEEEGNKRGKQVTLRLNDKDPAYYNQLQSNLEPFPFVKLSNQDANELIKSWAPTYNSHNLFFIDPHGYTQVSTESLQHLLTQPRSDFLIFLPINHIYRFLKPATNPEMESEKDRSYYKGIAKFLSGLKIAEEEAAQTETVEQFADVIVQALKIKSGSDFVYSQMLENKENSNKYALFFISHHVKGAEQFLVSQQKLKAKTKELCEQRAFDFMDAPVKSILDKVNYDYEYNNISLREQSIKWGYLPKELNQQLIDIEKNSPQSIEVKPLSGQTRTGNYFYVSNGKAPRISIVFRKSLF